MNEEDTWNYNNCFHVEIVTGRPQYLFCYQYVFCPGLLPLSSSVYEFSIYLSDHEEEQRPIYLIPDNILNFYTHINCRLTYKNKLELEEQRTQFLIRKLRTLWNRLDFGHSERPI